MPETTTQAQAPTPTMPIPAKWFPLKVGPNPAKRSGTDPAFCVMAHDGWPVSIFFTESYAAWFAQAANHAAEAPASA